MKAPRAFRLSSSVFVGIKVGYIKRRPSLVWFARGVKRVTREAKGKSLETESTVHMEERENEPDAVVTVQSTHAGRLRRSLR
jgi:hypothetical protein